MFSSLISSLIGGATQIEILKKMPKSSTNIDLTVKKGAWFQKFFSKPVRTILIHSLIVILFTCIYFAVGNYTGDKAKNWSTGKKLSFYDSFHFALTTHTTVGYGDIYPTSMNTRLVAHFHMMLVFFIVIMDFSFGG